MVCAVLGWLEMNLTLCTVPAGFFLCNSAEPVPANPQTRKPETKLSIYQDFMWNSLVREAGISDDEKRMHKWDFDGSIANDLQVRTMNAREPLTMHTNDTRP